MITMLITIEDTDKVDSVKKFISDNNIAINWEKQKSDSVWIEVTGEVLVVNKLYDLVVNFNRNKSNFFTKIKNKIVKTFEEFTQKGRWFINR
jgi:hypothetical protein